MKGTSIHLQSDSYQNVLKKNKLENFVLRLTYNFFIKHAEKNFKNKNIVCADIGCGEGRYARTFLLARNKKNKSKTNFIGVDASQAVGEKYKINNPNCEFILDNAEKLDNLNNEELDIISSHHNIEHLYEPYAFLKQCNRVLKKNGYLYLSCPNPSSLTAFYERKNWSGFATPEHVSLQAPFTYRQWLEENGFQIIKDGTTLLSGNPLIKKFRLLKLVNNMILVFFNGCINWPLGEAYVCISKKVKNNY